MKRMIAMLLMLCLLLSLASTALAQNTDALRIFDEWGACEAYAKQHPDQPIENLNQPNDGNVAFDLFGTLLSGEWDAAIVDTRDVNLQALYDAGLLADLSGDEAIAAQVSSMYAPVRDAVTKDGKTIGVPFLMFGLTQHISLTDNADTLAQLSMNEADKPTTFAEFAALCDRYMALDAETRRGTTFYGDIKPSSAKLYFIELFTTMYAAENRQTDGSVDFDTDAFHEGIALCGHIAETMQSQKTLYKKENSSLYCLTSEASNHWFENINYGQCVLTVGTEKQCPASMDVFIVNAKSSRKELAVDFVRSLMNMHPEWTGVEMMEQIDYDALAKLSYDQDIAAQIEQHEDQSVIDKLTAERDSGNYTRFYPEWTLETYRSEIVPYLKFPYAPYFDTYTPAQDYVAGKLDMDGLIQRLGQAVENSF
jgi:hypothetical protein